MDREAKDSIQKSAKALAGMFGKPAKGDSLVNGRVTGYGDDGMAWVLMDGATEAVPCNPEVASKVGDKVTIRLTAGGRAELYGNSTDPAINETSVHSRFSDVQAQIDATQAVAEEAGAAAEAIGQHFFYDDNGVHVTDVTRATWDAANEQAVDGVLPNEDAIPYHNIIVNSLGMLLRHALKTLVSVTKSAIAFFDGNGNETSNIVARFGSSGAQIGKASSTHVTVDSDSLDIEDGSSNVLATFGANSVQVGRADGYHTVINSNGFTMNQGTRTGLFNIRSSYEDYGDDGESRELIVFFDPYNHSYIRSWMDRRVDPQHQYNSLWMHNQKGNIEISDIDESGRYSFVTLDNGITLTEWSDARATEFIDATLNLTGFSVKKNYTTLLNVDSSGDVDVSGTFTSNEIQFSSSGADLYLSNKTKDMRIALTSSHNLRVDISSDSGGTWSTHGYAALGTQAPNATAYRAANNVFATPNGSAGLPSMRKLVAADMTGLGDTAKGAGQSSLATVKAATSVATATTVNLDTITLAAGTWLVTYSVEFASNATGRRVMTLTTNATSLTSTPLYMMSTAAANGLATNLSRSQVIVATASTTRYLNVYQNSGSALNCRSCIQAVRIA